MVIERNTMKYFGGIVIMMILSTLCGCHKATVQKIDTVFYDNGWDIEVPFVENGRTVLFKHTSFYDGDTHVMTYYILPSSDPKYDERVMKLYGEPKRPAAWTQEECDSMLMPFKDIIRLIPAEG